MKKLLKKLMFCLSAAIAILDQSTTCFAQDPAGVALGGVIHLDAKDNAAREFGLSTQYILDKTKSLSLSEVQAQSQVVPPVLEARHIFAQGNFSGQWRQSDMQSLSLGYADAAWVRFSFMLDASGGEILPPVQSKAQAAPYWLTLGFAQMDKAQLWCKDSEGREQYREAGDHIGRDRWSIQAREPSFAVDIPLSGVLRCWLRVESGTSIQVPLKLQRAEAAQIHASNDLAVQGLYFGALVIMVLYNALVGAASRSTAYLFYSLFLMGFGGIQLVLTGLGYQYLWAQYPGLSDYVLPLAIAGTAVSANFFAGVLLGWRPREQALVLGKARDAAFRAQQMQLWRVTLGVSFVYGLLCLALFVLPVAYVLRAMLVMVAVWVLSVMGGGIWQAMHSDRLAQLFVAAWGSFVAGVAIKVLIAFGVVPLNIWTGNAAQVGSVLEFVLLSFALSWRIRQLQESVLAGERKALETLKRSEQDLEEKVENRTLELSASLVQLKVAQAQLIQSEKMAALGVLVDNVAHELNSPLSSLTSSAEILASTLTESLEDWRVLAVCLEREHYAVFQSRVKALVLEGGAPWRPREEREVLKALTQVLQAHVFPTREEAIVAARVLLQWGVFASDVQAMYSTPYRSSHRIGSFSSETQSEAQSSAQPSPSATPPAEGYQPLFRFILEHPRHKDLFSALYSIGLVLRGSKNIAQASRKITEKVQALKAYSQADYVFGALPMPIVPALQEAVNAFNKGLAVAPRNNPPAISLYITPAPEAPDLQQLSLLCNFTDFQQAIAHLLSNASYALQNNTSLNPPTIAITLTVKADPVPGLITLAITDNGCGIPLNLVDKVFNPFFTTRNAGESSGMGLAITRKLVEKYQGTLTILSEEKQGTTVTIIWPLAA